MNPQKLSQLDPKLREAYQRVMGTAIPKPQAKSDLAQAAPAQTPPPPTKPSDSAPAPAFPSGPTSGSIPAPTPEPQPTPPQSPPSIQESPIPQPIIPKPEPVPEPSPAIPQQEASPSGGFTSGSVISPEPPTQANNFVQMNSEVPVAPAANPSLNFTAPAETQTTAVKKKSNLLMPILIGVGAIVFIAVYALFWTQFFHFKLPFLP